MQQAAERARALVSALNGDAESLRQHQQKDSNVAEGVTLCERASHDAAELLKLLEQALDRRGTGNGSSGSNSTAVSPPLSKPEQEPA